jgi:hypothetical protein
MVDHTDEILYPVTAARGALLTINSVTQSTNGNAADILSGDNFGELLQANVKKDYVQLTRPSKANTIAELDVSPSLGNVQSLKKKQVDSTLLAERWNIDPKKARNNGRQTT